MKHYEFMNSYINPITRARDLKKILVDEGLNQDQLAKKLDLSKARVTQLLNLLKLPAEKQEEILNQGKKNLITERKLRSAGFQ